MKNWKLISAVSMCLALSGCYTPAWQKHCDNVKGFSDSLNCRKEADRQHEYEEKRAAEQLKLNARNAKCDSYGFRRGTSQFSQCLQQAEQQESIDAANQMRLNEINRQAQDRQWRKTQCYASGRLDC